MSNPEFVFQESFSANFAAEPLVAIDWLWQGYLAAGATTLFTSQWKAGKTTLVSVLLARLATGGDLAGLPVSKCRAAIVSEERVENWRRRSERLHFGDNLVFLCRPFSSRPTPESWLALVEHLARLGEQHDIRLVVIDPLASCLPGAVENQSSAILDVLQPLERLTAAGQSVLLLHHPRKGETVAGQAARGSGALSAFVDVLVEMKLPRDAQPPDRRRRLSAWSRYDQTPRERVIELTRDGTDYHHSSIETVHVRSEQYLDVVRHLLTCPPRKLTRLQLLKVWPKGAGVPHPVRLWRVLDWAVKEGTLQLEGNGHKRDPFRYFLPNLEADWMPDLGELLGMD